MTVFPAKPGLQTISDKKQQFNRFWIIQIILLLAIFFAVVLSVSIGIATIPFERVVKIILSHLMPSQILADWPVTQDHIVWIFRLPRTLLAVVVGATLAVSGTTLQAVTRNPLADPYVFGVSYGATTGVVLVYTLGPGAAMGSSLSLAAFLGALTSMFMVYMLAQHHGRVTPMRLVLAGVALGYMLWAISHALILRTNTATAGDSFEALLAWLSGSLGNTSWSDLGIPSVVVLISTFYLLLQSRSLNALLAGEETATCLGVDIDRFRKQLFCITSLLVGVVVAVSGAIGFIGLMIPHLVRMILGPDHRRVLTTVALSGALYLVLADLLARTIMAPQELPVGIVTSAIGAPFFLWVLRQNKR